MPKQLIVFVQNQLIYKSQLDINQVDNKVIWQTKFNKAQIIVINKFFALAQIEQNDNVTILNLNDHRIQITQQLLGMLSVEVPNQPLIFEKDTIKCGNIISTNLLTRQTNIINISVDLQPLQQDYMASNLKQGVFYVLSTQLPQNNLQILKVCDSMLEFMKIYLFFDLQFKPVIPGRTYFFPHAEYNKIKNQIRSNREPKQLMDGLPVPDLFNADNLREYIYFKRNSSKIFERYQNLECKNVKNAKLSRINNISLGKLTLDDNSCIQLEFDERLSKHLEHSYIYQKCSITLNSSQQFNIIGVDLYNFLSTKHKVRLPQDANQNISTAIPIQSTSYLVDDQTHIAKIFHQFAYQQISCIVNISSTVLIDHGIVVPLAPYFFANYYWCKSNIVRILDIIPISGDQCLLGARLALISGKILQRLLSNRVENIKFCGIAEMTLQITGIIWKDCIIITDYQQ